MYSFAFISKLLFEYLEKTGNYRLVAEVTDLKTQLKSSDLEQQRLHVSTVIFHFIGHLLRLRKYGYIEIDHYTAFHC